MQHTANMVYGMKTEMKLCKSASAREKTLINLLFFLLLAASCALMFFFIGPVEGINDDWGMYSILSGAYTGTPDAHVMFFLYPLSALLAGLYRLKSAVPWFGLFQHGAQIFCLYTVYRRILHIHKRRYPEKSCLFPGVTVFFLLFFVVNLNVLAEAQYTTTAGLSAATALFSFASARTNQSVHSFLLDNVPTFVFAWLSFSMRQNIFYLMLPMAGMLWLSKWILAHRNRQTDVWLKLCSFALILGLGMGLLWGVNAFAYAAPEWADFRKINHYRERVGDFYGWPEYEECKEALSAIGVDEETYWYRRNGAPYIGYGMSVSDWKAMHDIAREHYLSRTSLKARLKAVAVGFVCAFFYEDGIQPTGLFTLALFPLTLALILRARNFQAFFVFCMYLFGRSVSWVYVLYEGRFPKRIVQPLLTVDCLVLFALLLSFRLLRLEGAFRRIALSALIFALSAAAFQVTRGNVAERYRVHEETWRGLRAYCASHPENFYVWTHSSGTLDHFYETPFGGGQDAYQNFFYTNWGVACNPNTRKKLAAQGIGGFGRDVVDSDHVYFILEANPYNEEHPVLSYFRHSYDAELQEADSFTAGETVYGVYRLVPK